MNNKQDLVLVLVLLVVFNNKLSIINVIISIVKDSKKGIIEHNKYLTYKA